MVITLKDSWVRWLVDSADEADDSVSVLESGGRKKIIAACRLAVERGERLVEWVWGS